MMTQKKCRFFMSDLLLSVFLWVASVVTISCNEASEPNAVAEKFLSDYLECRFSACEGMASPDVLEQMRWRASNLTQAEVELMSEQRLSVRAQSDDVIDVYGERTVTFLAHNVLLLDSVGRPGHIGDGRFVVVMRPEGENWRIVAVKMLAEER